MVRNFIILLLILSASTAVLFDKCEASVSLNAGKLLITEAAFDEPAASNDWLELYVVDNSVDWSGTKLWRSQSTWCTLPTGSYSGVEYIVIHEGTGTTDTNGNIWHLYGMLDLVATDYLLYLNDSDSDRTNNVIDVLIWANYNGTCTVSEADANALVADGLWDNDYYFEDNGSNGDFAAWGDSDTISAGMSLSRYRNFGGGYRDTNSRSDWYAEDTPTQGAANTQAVPAPSAMMLLIPGLFAVLCLRRVKK